MAAKLYYNPFVPAFSNIGVPLAFSKLYFYLTTTLTPAPIFSDAALTIPLTSPITANLAGKYVDVYLDDSIVYKVVQTEEDGTPIGDAVDPYIPGQGYIRTPSLPELLLPNGSSLVGFIQSGTGAVTRSSQSKLRELGKSVTDYSSAAGIASFEAYDGLVSAQADITEAQLASERTTGSVTLPEGKYPVTQILVPADNVGEMRGYPFTLSGAGNGEPFVENNALRRGTVIVGSDPTKSAILTRVRSGGAAAESAGTLKFDSFRVEHTSNAGVAAIDLATFYGPAMMNRVDIRQYGLGDGLKVGFMATGTIKDAYLLGPDWLGVAPGVRTGIGFKLTMAADAGLGEINKITSRGWGEGFRIGAPAGFQVLGFRMSGCETSFCDNAIVVTNAAKNFTIDSHYDESCLGTVVADAGRATAINNLFCELTFSTGVALSGPGGGTTGGYFSMRSTGATAIRVNSGQGNYVLGPQIRWGGNNGTNTCVGVEISAGADPRVTLAGASFEPEGQWLGSGSTKIKDSSYSSVHGGVVQLNGSGVFGYMERETGNYAVIPALSRGSINLHVDGQFLTDPYVTSNTLTLSNASVQYLSLSSAQTVVRFAAKNLPDKTGMLFIDNGNVTFTPSVYLVGIAQPLQLPAGKQAWIEYQVLPTANAPTAIRNVHLVDSRFTVAQLATLKGQFSQTIIASNGRRAAEAPGAGTGCPVWWDGTDWLTMYDNTVVAA